MKVCIHRGANQIGGSCVEIESDGRRLVIDIGLPLDADPVTTPLPDIAGLNGGDDSLLGIAISHAHLDHYGLASKVGADVPIIVSEGSLRILGATRLFFSETVEFQNPIRLRHQTPIRLEPFTIIPFLMDHSAYDAYAFLIEAGGKRIFYTGDFRGHGRKGRLLDKIVQNPPCPIDALLMEGSTLGRNGNDNVYFTEDALENQFVQKFEASGGLTLVWTSGQNIDRLVTLYKSCRKTGKKLIVDLYTANILKALANPHLPQPGWKDIRVFVPRWQRIRIKQNKRFDVARKYSFCRIYPEELSEIASSAVMLFRPSMCNDLVQADCLQNSSLIYSLWSGYLKEPQYHWLQPWLDEHGIPLTHCHISGHAHTADLQRLARALAPKMLVPIHTFEPHRYETLFDNVELKNDGERWQP